MSTKDTNTIKHLFRELKSGLYYSKYAKNHLLDIGFSEEEITKAPLGYVPTNERLKDALEKSEASMPTLESWGILKSNMDYKIVMGWEQLDGTIKLCGLSFGNKNKDEKTFSFQAGFKKDLPYLYNQYLTSSSDTVVLVDSPIDAARLQANSIAAMGLGSSSLIKEQINPLVRKNKKYIYCIQDTAKARSSAEKLVLSLSKFNTDIQIIEINNKNAINSSIFNKMSISKIKAHLEDRSTDAASFLASRITSQQKSGTNKHVTTKTHKWDRELSNNDSLKFKKELDRNNISIEKDKAQAFRLMAELLDSNIEYKEALDIVEQRFQVVIKCD